MLKPKAKKLDTESGSSSTNNGQELDETKTNSSSVKREARGNEKPVLFILVRNDLENQSEKNKFLWINGIFEALNIKDEDEDEEKLQKVTDIENKNSTTRRSEKRKLQIPKTEVDAELDPSLPSTSSAHQPGMKKTKIEPQLRNESTDSSNSDDNVSMQMINNISCSLIFAVSNRYRHSRFIFQTDQKHSLTPRK